MNIIKTRFAPSPTGYLHLGSIRTAIYSWLYSQHYNGKFILRIEDTDIKRSIKNSIQTIIEGMNWLNLTWDEGPYYQSQRLDRYRIIIKQMLKNNIAYRCYCSNIRLHDLRKKQIHKGEKPRYDGFCRNNLDHSKYYYKLPYVIRFCNPTDGVVIFKDLIRGIIKINNCELDDLIIQRTDGIPTYNFCVVIDDWDMDITHVIRGEEHINNTPRQINILKALGAPIPQYAHVSMILGNDGKKLSKRHGAINILEYRNNGFLPEAVLNYLIRLGWSYGNQEIFDRNEMIKYFSLSSINKSASIFAYKKLLWFNHYYINSLPTEYIATHLDWHLKQLGINIQNGPCLQDIIKLLCKRCKTLKEMAESCNYFYQEFDLLIINNIQYYLNLKILLPLQNIRQKIEIINPWTQQNIHDAIQSTIIQFKINMEQICMPLRIAITGQKKSPSIDKIIHIIGKINSLKRIDIALNYINNN